MGVHVLRAEDRVAVPWRNGAGSTREVAVGGADEVGFDWRISLADIDRDGPFSSYDGYTRIMSLVQGDGLDLVVDGQTHRIDRRSAPFAFDGGSPAMCRLVSGPVLALNVIGRRESILEIARPASGMPIEAADEVVALVLDGAARLSPLTPMGAVEPGKGDGDPPRAYELGGYDAVLVDRATGDVGSLCLAPTEIGSVIAVIRIGRPVDRPPSSRLRW